MTARAAQPVDIAIVGGGMVGASLALALSGSGRRLALVEALAPGAPGQPSFDERTTALGNGSRRVLETLGVWPLVAAQACAVREIHVSDAGRPGAARLSAAGQDLDALGHVVPNRSLGAALWQRLAGQRDIHVLCPAQLRGVELAARSARLELETADGSVALEAGVVVAADGAHSLVRKAAGIEADVADYRQVALVANVATDRPANGIAYERFTATGPLAVLPLADGSYTVVWTLAPQRARQVAALDDAAFIDALQQAFGWRIGRMRRAGACACYPLQLSRAGALVGTRTVLVGNAAQSLHPVAGQGFNLGLRDAALLAEMLAVAPDPGAAALLEQYELRRAADRGGMIGFTDGLVRLFATEQAGIACARNLGLMLFELLPEAKRALARLSWGFGADAPRLLRGLPVSGWPGAAHER